MVIENLLNQELSLPDEDLERLMEVDSNVKTAVEIERKKKRKHYIILTLCFILFIIFICLEVSQKTQFSKKIIDSCNVAKEKNPQDGNVIPLSASKGSPLLMSDPAIDTELLERTIPPNPEDTKDSKVSRKS